MKLQNISWIELCMLKEKWEKALREYDEAVLCFNKPWPQGVSEEYLDKKEKEFETVKTEVEQYGFIEPTEIAPAKVIFEDPDGNETEWFPAKNYRIPRARPTEQKITQIKEAIQERNLLLQEVAEAKQSAPNRNFAYDDRLTFNVNGTSFVVDNLKGALTKLEKQIRKYYPVAKLAS